MLQILIFIVSLGARAIRTMCRRRADLVLENLALRQQMTAFKKERPRPVVRENSVRYCQVSAAHAETAAI